MSEQLTRIGRGVPGVPERAPGQRPPLRLWLGGGAFAAVLVFLGTYVLFDGRPAAPLSPVAPTSAVPAADLGIEATCVLLIPLASTSLELVDAIVAAPDGSSINWAKLETTVTDLSTAKGLAPREMRDDIQSQIDPLLELQQRYHGTWPSGGLLDLSEYRASGLRIAARCAPYGR